MWKHIPRKHIIITFIILIVIAIIEIIILKKYHFYDT
jgi:hypothetical protein